MGIPIKRGVCPSCFQDGAACKCGDSRVLPIAAFDKGPPTVPPYVSEQTSLHLRQATEFVKDQQYLVRIEPDKWHGSCGRTIPWLMCWWDGRMFEYFSDGDWFGWHDEVLAVYELPRIEP